MEFFRLLVVRLIASALTVFVVISIVFFVSRVVGNPIDYLLPIDTTPEERERITEEFGLNDPIPIQYKDFLLDAQTKRIVLTPFATNATCRAVVFTNEATSEAFLVIEGLPPAPSYTLQVKRADGSLEEVETFVSNGGLGGMRLEAISAAALVATTWQITSNGAALLGSV